MQRTAVPILLLWLVFFFSSRRRHTRSSTVSWARNVYKSQVHGSSGARTKVIGNPVATAVGDPGCPPFGSWQVWGMHHFVLRNEPPNKILPEPPYVLDFRFGTVTYAESGAIGRLHIVFRSVAITDEALEAALSNFSQLLRKLAGRHLMSLLIRSDARMSVLPSMRHVFRFLSFVRDNGPEFVLVGRGHVIVLKQSGIVAHALLRLVRFVQQVMPAPYPEATVTTLEEADCFLEKLAEEIRMPHAHAAVDAAAATGTTDEPPAAAVELSPLMDGVAHAADPAAAAAAAAAAANEEGATPSVVDQLTNASVLPFQGAPLANDGDHAIARPELQDGQQLRDGACRYMQLLDPYTIEPIDGGLPTSAAIILDDTPRRPSGDIYGHGGRIAGSSLSEFWAQFALGACVAPASCRLCADATLSTHSIEPPPLSFAELWASLGLACTTASSSSELPPDGVGEPPPVL
eukprot:NODE_5207_length_1797_cov_16.910778.p1 GENE.NODE_5207_length_1797_cov_16.910778~~NODE_5207_length_1797_cov_16.910778.p1  ORF type:complete len:461 (-),score=88.65 NODE_5207_length_1797_cov_16.910778:358-1740(-)